MAAKSLSINSLLLDLENPRITRAGSQRDALQRILEDQGVRLAKLAESIVAEGRLNPMDRWLVLRQGDSSKFVVYEGNRRLAALKILSNPSVLGSLEIKPALRKRFEKAANHFDVDNFGKIDCYVINSRAEGAIWLHQRHTGQNLGSGIVDWSGVATARFRGTDPALQALNFVLNFGEFDAEAKAEIENGFPITTLDRLLSSRPVRALIGIDVKQSKLLTSLPAQAALKVLSRIVSDLASGEKTVSDLKNQTAQVSYIKSLREDLPDLSTRSGEEYAVDEVDASAFATGGSSHQSRGAGDPHQTPPETKTPPKPKPAHTARKRSYQRRTLITNDCILNVSNAKIREIEVELRTLQLSTHRHAIAVLFRVFLETSVDAYLTSKGIPLTVTDKGGHTRDKNLTAKVTDAIAQMVAEGVPEKYLDGVSKGIHDKHNAIYINTLHAYVHNQFYSPKESDLTVAFDNARPFLEAIWK